MRTTIMIDDNLFKNLKKRAVDQGLPMGKMIEEAIRSFLERGRKSGIAPKRFKLVTYRGDGLKPGIDIDRTSTLADVDDVTELS